jgi:hypothetical protein
MDSNAGNEVFDPTAENCRRTQHLTVAVASGDRVFNSDLRCISNDVEYKRRGPVIDE